ALLGVVAGGGGDERAAEQGNVLEERLAALLAFGFVLFEPPRTACGDRDRGEGREREPGGARRLGQGERRGGRDGRGAVDLDEERHRHILESHFFDRRLAERGCAVGAVVRVEYRLDAPVDDPRGQQGPGDGA